MSVSGRCRASFNTNKDIPLTSQVQPKPRKHHDVVVALGANQRSNLGKPEETINLACGVLSERIGFSIRKSHLYQTPAFPAGAGPDFVNAAAVFKTHLSPDAILQICHEIEEMAGRTREVRWGQRTLDIDLIAFDDVVLPDHTTHEKWRMLPLEDQVRLSPDQLIVPHPRLQDRSFVLVPMADVAPDWVHPILGQTTRQMLDARPAAEKDTVCPLDAA